MSVQSFRDSLVWQKAMELATSTYRATRSFPKEELFGMTSQLRRSAVSIASNIAEGQGRLTTGEFMQFLGVARGSALELQTQLELAKRLGFGSSDELQRVESTSTEVVKMLNAALTRLRKNEHSGSSVD